MRTLVMGLGNDLLADDAVGLVAARALRPELNGRADVIECVEHGLALLDYFLDYDRAVLIDAVRTGKHPVGTVLSFGPEDFAPTVAPSPHFAGIPDLLVLAEQMSLPFPRHFAIFAVEVADTTTIGGPMTGAVSAAVPALCERVRQSI